MKIGTNILTKNAKQNLFACVMMLAFGAVSAQTYTVVYTGSAQTVTLPQTGTYEIECWGADGGDITAGPGGGGKGGYSIGTFNISTPGSQLEVYVGGKGLPGTGTTASAGAGGWNGGGGGAAVGRSGAGGGGATDVRFGGTGPGNRIIVAGGGGGAAYYSTSPFLAYGGHGGGTAGLNGDIITSAGVLTVGGGGAGANGSNPGAATVGTANGSGTHGGGGGGISAGTSIGQPGVGGGAGGSAGPSSSGSTGSAGGGGGGYAGGAGGVQTSNAGVAGGGGSGYVGGVMNGTTAVFLQPGYVTNPDINGNGYAIIKYKCDVDVQASKNPICIGETITLSTNAGSNIQWSHGPTTPSVIVTPSVNTSYTLIGISSSTTGCAGTVVVNVTVNPLPVVSAASFPTVVCQGNTGTLTSFGALSYTWNPGNTSGNVLISSPSASSIYTVSGESAHGCVNTATVALDVNTNQLVMSPDTSICIGSPAYLRANGALYYAWDFGAPFNNVTVYPTTTTIYTVGATDMYNCSLSGSVTVIVKSLPVVGVNASQTLICSGEELQLTANGATTYTWNTGENGASIAPSTAIDLPKTYIVTGTGSNGCSNSASVTVIISACTGLIEENELSFNIMPNPANTHVSIESDREAAYKVSDLSGRVLFEGKIQAGVQSLDVSALPDGIYLVQLQSGNSIQSTKLIKN